MNKRVILLLAVSCILLIVGMVLIFSSKRNSYQSVKGIQTNQLMVVKVLDGDTAVTNDGKHIRYLGINTAEKGEAYATEAKQLNEQLVLNKPIRFEFDSETTDRYGRTLAYVFVGDTFVNQVMVQQGMAIAEFFQKNMKYETDLTQAQQQARSGCVGMWNGLCHSDQAGCLKIPEIHQADKAKDKNGEWIVLENDCEFFISLGGFLLKDNSSSNRYTFTGTKLAAHQQITLHSGCGNDTQQDIFWSCPAPEYGIWNDTGDHAFLYNTQGQLVADYEY